MSSHLIPIQVRAFACQAVKARLHEDPDMLEALQVFDNFISAVDHRTADQADFVLDDLKTSFVLRTVAEAYKEELRRFALFNREASRFLWENGRPW